MTFTLHVKDLILLASVMLLVLGWAGVLYGGMAEHTKTYYGGCACFVLGCLGVLVSFFTYMLA